MREGRRNWWLATADVHAWYGGAVCTLLLLTVLTVVLAWIALRHIAAPGTYLVPGAIEAGSAKIEWITTAEQP